MISRNAAEKALKKCNYERHSVSPSIQAMRQGISINVYFTQGVSKSYSFGANGKIHGYIAPAKYIHDHKAIQKMIGYSGSIIVIDSEGNHVAH